MSLDLSAAVEPLAEALFRWNTPTDPYFVIHGRPGEYVDEDCYLPIARAALTAAAPLIEAQVRAQVAAEIRAGIVAEPLLMYVTDWRDGMETAAEIAGGTP